MGHSRPTRLAQSAAEPAGYDTLHVADLLLSGVRRRSAHPSGLAVHHASQPIVGQYAAAACLRYPLRMAE